MQRESDLFITSMITDRIGRHGALLPIKVLQKEKKIMFSIPWKFNIILKNK